jgi:hypothetical protein
VPDRTGLCPSCAGRLTVLAKVATIDPASGLHCDLCTCAACLHWWIEPMPSQAELNHLYEAGSPLVIRTGWVTEQTDSLTVADNAVLKNEPNLHGCRYLEIGVGKGRLFMEVARRGAKVVGVEPGVWGHNLQSVVNDLAELPQNATFDVLVANDVLEHLESPVAMLSTLRMHTHPSSRLYCRFPNSQSLRARMQKERWNMVRPLGHLHYFSRQSAQNMFARGGWSITKAEPSEVQPQRLISRILDSLRLGDQWLIQASPTSREAA